MPTAHEPAGQAGRNDPTDQNDQAPPDAPGPTPADALKQQLVESLMGVIGAPDDADAARTADDVLRTLDAELAQESAAA
ncbi:hypothetical protein KQH42_29925 [Streptomyces sp. CHA1]|uniref:hypothetical protein n=1 Tax=Actinomycetes TaxID=1760 RepID=UPI0002F337DE|nr:MULTISPECIES: hypothetical protein [unclassified Streptomyces]QOZ97972.1 hypothetical protein DI273_00260 [Streptomyces violascens]WDV34165.1 hypothetical protein OIM90_31985 [Streptomyces sp. AD16]WSB18780.1 hypothetical protein OHB02_00350 [Streptomyces albidoflavus]ESP95818.1 hypothetical protein B591_30059 [Streptomyces sp. GBA 94-10 4N24]ESQ01683.1 hypothetical protein B591_00240 [Streptomyces sp. GBA 94-10 4N24]